MPSPMQSLGAWEHTHCYPRVCTCSCDHNCSATTTDAVIPFYRSGAFSITCTGRFNATLLARDTGGGEVVVNRWAFEIKPVDTDVAAYGPNGTACVNNGVADDGTPMDGSFTCNCSATLFSGLNCEVSNAASTDDNLTVWAAAMGAMVTVGIAALAASRYQLYRARRQPEDMAELQAELLASVGMGPTMSLRPSQMGFMLRFAADFEALTDTETATLEAAVLEVARGLEGLPRRLAAAFGAKDAVAQLSPETGHILLAVPRPSKRKLRHGEEEAFAAALWRHVVSETFVVVSGEGPIRAIDVAVAVAQRVPSEIDSCRITRIDLLGEGAWCRRAATARIHAFNTLRQSIACLVFVDACATPMRTAGSRVLCVVGSLTHTTVSWTQATTGQ
jgi:hypothetical protein